LLKFPALEITPIFSAVVAFRGSGQRHCPPELWAVGKFAKNLFAGNFFPEMQNFKPKPPILEKIESKVKISNIRSPFRGVFFSQNCNFLHVPFTFST